MGFGRTFAGKMAKRSKQYAIRSTYDLYPYKPKKVKKKKK